MDLTRILTIDHKYWEKVWVLYQQSFPTHETRLLENQIEAMKEESYHCDMVMEEDGLIGIIFYWEWEDAIYIEHFAISPAFRGQQYGTRILKKFLEQASKTVILEIDPPIDVISKRRLKFYENIGFKMNDYDYSHTPYRKGVERHTLKILSYQRYLSQEKYDAFYGNVNEKAMLYVEQ